MFILAGLFYEENNTFPHYNSYITYKIQDASLHQCIWVSSFFHHLNFKCFSVFFSVFVALFLWLLWFNVFFIFTVDCIKKTNKCGYRKKKLYHREVTFLVNNNYPYSGLQVLGHILPDQFHKSFLLL